MLRSCSLIITKLPPTPPRNKPPGLIGHVKYYSSTNNIHPLPAFCFDIDGVLKQGSFVLPFATKALQILDGLNPAQLKFPFILCTNGGGLPEVERSKKLSQELGVTISPNQLVQSHTIFTQFLSDFADKPVLVIGGRGQRCRSVAQGYGFKVVYTPLDIVHWNPSVWPFLVKSSDHLDSPHTTVDFSKISFKAIFVMHDSFDWGLDIQVAIDVLTSPDGVISNSAKKSNHSFSSSSSITPPPQQIPIFFSNPDILWGNEFCRPRFGQGAFQTALRANYLQLTGRPLEAWTGGKPSRVTYQFANQLLNNIVQNQFKLPSLGPVYMIGDNPASDIQGANNFGWSSVLVKTGVFKGDKPEDAAFVPTTVQNDVLEGVKWALNQEGYSHVLQ